MIHHEDLMYGNLIMDDKCGGVVTKFGHPHAYQPILNTCSGIPVTVDMLKRIGFKEDTTAGESWPYWRYWDKRGKYKLDVYPDELYCNGDRKFGLHIDNDVCSTIGSGEFTYVHELQNLVRVITGYELPITIEMVWEKESTERT